MAQHLQPRHLSGQQNPKKQSTGASRPASASGRRASSEETAPRRRTAQEQETYSRAVPEQEEVTAQRTTSSQRAASERRPAAERGTASGRRAETFDDFDSFDDVPAAYDDYDEAPVRRRQSYDDYDDAPARRRSSYDDYDEAPVRRRSSYDDGYGRAPAQRKATFDDYDDAPAKAPGRGGLVVIAILKALVSLLLVGVVGLFGLFLWSTGMLPTMFFAAACVLLGLLLIIILVLLWFSKKSAPLYTGIVLALVCAGGLLFAYRTLAKGVDTLHNITDVTTAVTHVGVYVLQNDQAQSLGDITNYSFGVVDEMSREAVDETINQLDSELSIQIQPIEYANVGALVDALRGGSVQAAIVSQSQLEALQDSDGYTGLDQELREVTLMRIEHDVVDDLSTASVPPAVTDEAFTVYISGIDSRNGLVDDSRSDVNIIATVNPTTHQVLLVSTPRDYYVPLSISNGAPDKLTHAGMYGIGVSMDTLEMLYGIDIDYYFRLSFDGFEDIIDALGGVTVNSDAEFWDYTNTYYFTEGENQLDGAAALAFARERKAFNDGDRVRGRHQMEVIRAVAQKVLSTDLLANYSSVLSAVEGSFEMSIPYDMISAMVQKQLSDGGEWNIVSYTVNGEANWEAECFSLPGTRYVLVPDQNTVDEATDLMTQVLNNIVVEPPQS